MSELGDFLRTRREQLRPAEVGLPDGGRRRTPGLRREEVATLAGVSVDYLIRLEQGRDTNPSLSIVQALANALRLNEDEQLHLKQLAACTAHGEFCPKGEPAAEVAPNVLAILDRLDPTPAFVLGHQNDVLAWNPAWERLVAPLGLLDERPPNLARFVFLQPASRQAYPDWEAAADEQVGQLRSVSPRWAADPPFLALLEDLGGNEEFARRWAAHEVAPKRRGTKSLRHPTAGLLHVDVEVLRPEDEAEQRLVSWLPADEATAAALRGTARLRAV